MFWARSISCDIAQSPHNTVYQFRYDLEPFLCKLVGLGATHGVEHLQWLGHLGGTDVPV